MYFSIDMFKYCDNDFVKCFCKLFYDPDDSHTSAYKEVDS